MSAPTDHDRIRLPKVGLAVAPELDRRAVLDRILEEARAITGARYAALEVLNDQGPDLGQLLATSVDASNDRRVFGDLPGGRRGLGVPIVIGGEAWGNLCLAKEDGEFTEADEEAAAILADWAATAIEDASRYQGSERRREDLERAVRGLEATRDIVIAIGAETSVERVLELIAKRGRALVDAQSMLIMLREGAHLVVAAAAGRAADAYGLRLPVENSTSGQVLERGQPERIADVASRLRISPARLGVPDAHAGLLVPMIHRGEALGVLAAFDRDADGGGFTEDDEQLMRTFAATAATAVAMAQSVESGRLRSAIAAAEAERGRWARELHDQTLQSLGGLRVLLASALRGSDGAANEEAMRQAIQDIELEIGNLRAIISDLRLSLLDDFGLLPALEALLERRGGDGLTIVSELALPDPEQGRPGLDPELETTVYRLVQEALTNVAKHSRATSVRVAVTAEKGQVTVEVQDDGIGFKAEAQTPGFGIAGMRERVYLAGGALVIESSERGTLLRASLLAPQASRSGGESGADQAAS